MPIWCRADDAIFVEYEHEIELPEKAQDKPEGKAFLRRDGSGLLALVAANTGRHPTMYIVPPKCGAENRFAVTRVTKPQFSEDNSWWAYDFMCLVGDYVFMDGPDARAARLDSVDCQSVGKSFTPTWLPCYKSVALEDGPMESFSMRYHFISEVASHKFLGCVEGTVQMVSFEETSRGLCMNVERVWPYSVSEVVNALGRAYGIDEQEEYKNQDVVCTYALYTWSLTSDEKPTLLVRTGHAIDLMWASDFEEGMLAFLYENNELCIIFPDDTVLRYKLGTCVCSFEGKNAGHTLQENDGCVAGAFLSKRWFIIADSPHSLLWVDLYNKRVSARYILDVPIALKDNPNYEKLMTLRTECESNHHLGCTFPSVVERIERAAFVSELEELNSRNWKSRGPTAMCPKCRAPLQWALFAYCPNCGWARTETARNRDDSSDDEVPDAVAPTRAKSPLDNGFQEEMKELAVENRHKPADVLESADDEGAVTSNKHKIPGLNNPDIDDIDRRSQELRVENDKFYTEMEKRAEQRALESILGFKQLDTGSILVARRVLLQVFWTRVRFIPAACQ